MGWREANLVRLTKCAAKGWIDDRAPSMGAAVAFYSILSLAPLLLVVVALAGMFVGREAAHTALIEELARYMGDGLARAVQGILEASGTKKEGVIATALGTVALLLGATTVFGELRKDLESIWRHRAAKKGIGQLVTSRLKEFGMVAAGGLVLLATMLASTWLSAMAKWFPIPEGATVAIDFGVSFLVVTLLFAMIYKVLPGAHIDWGDVWVGAAVTSALFWVGKYAIALYLSKAAVGSSFGAAGAVVALLVWIYYSSQIFFLGAEFTRQYALHYGSRQGEPEDRRRWVSPEAANAEDADVARAKRILQAAK